MKEGDNDDGTQTMASNQERAEAAAEGVFSLFNQKRVNPPDGIVALLMCLSTAGRLLIMDPPKQEQRELNKAQLLEQIEELRKRIAAVPTDDATCQPEKKEIDHARVMARTLRAAMESGKKKEEVFH